MRKPVSAVYSPVNKEYSSTIRDLTLGYLKEINNCTVELEKYRVMHKKDPVVRSCIELKCLRSSLLFGEYSHKDPKIEKWVKENLDNMDGSLTRDIARLSGACAEGFKVAEIIFSNKLSGYKGEWRLKSLNVLDSARVSFEGRDGEIESVVYVDGAGKEIRIPYKKCLHIVNGSGVLGTSIDYVRGDPESRVAYPYFKAKQTMLTEMMVAAKTNAMGLLVGKTDSNAAVEMLRPDGSIVRNADGTARTEPALAALLRALQAAENNGIVVTDKNNEVMPMSIQTSEGFWNMGLNMFDQAIRRAYGVPDLIFNEGSSSIQFGNLGKQHLSTFDSQLSSIVQQIQDQMIERVIRPLLIFNKGTSKNFGEFTYSPKLDPEQSALKMQNISMLIQNQIVPAQDLRVANAMLELAGLESITEEEQNLNMQRRLISAWYDMAINLDKPIPGVTPAFAMTPPPEAAHTD